MHDYTARHYQSFVAEFDTTAERYIIADVNSSLDVKRACVHEPAYHFAARRDSRCSIEPGPIPCTVYKIFSTAIDAINAILR